MPEAHHAPSPDQSTGDGDEIDREFWKRRSAGYSKLDWPSQGGYLDAFIATGTFAPSDRVLDIGTGTGIIAARIAPLARQVVGIDISPDMLEIAKQQHKAANLEFHVGDVRTLDFPVESFDKVTARMVFHHVLMDAEQGIRDIWKVLARGGKFVFSEGVPPIRELGDWYTEMFALKEERRTFFEEEIVALIGSAPFTKIETGTYIVRQASIRNWLENGAVSKENQAKIWQMHLDLNAQGKHAYNMTETDGDILIDMKFVIACAVK